MEEHVEDGPVEEKRYNKETTKTLNISSQRSARYGAILGPYDELDTD